MYKFIKSWSDYILNETLKTNDIDFVLKDIQSELRLSGIDCDLTKKDNKMELIIYDFNNLYVIEDMFRYIDSLFIDRNGWFPSKMLLKNNSEKENELKYDEDYLINKQQSLKNVIITYEPKFDIETTIPEKMYHLSIQQYESSIMEYGLIPKTKNKKTIYLDRLYLCKNKSDCDKLIPNMKYDYEKRKIQNIKDNINIKWIIYEINTKGLDITLYKDPNYKDKGYYVVDNIPQEKIDGNNKRIKVIDKE